MRALEWRDVDSTGSVVRLRPEISKNKDGRVLPLRGELLALMERARTNRRLDCVRVFHINSKPVGDFGKSWATACRKAGLAGTIIHDLRRTAVRNMVARVFLSGWQWRYQATRLEACLIAITS
jgi:integrase